MIHLLRLLPPARKVCVSLAPYERVNDPVTSESMMSIEKNSVLGENNQSKTASRADRCPLCGKSVDLDGSLPRCPTHGTSPFEAGAHIRRRNDHRGTSSNT